MQAIEIDLWMTIELKFSIAIYGRPSPEGKPEKIEFLVRIIAPAGLIHIVDNLCLFRMQF
jgi:hypothetical protein